MSNLAIYLIGALIVAIALGYALHLLGVATIWIVLAGALLIGMSIMGGVQNTRRPERPAS